MVGFHEPDLAPAVDEEGDGCDPEEEDNDDDPELLGAYQVPRRADGLVVLKVVRWKKRRD